MDNPAVPRGTKIALALMFAPVVCVAILIPTKTILPVFPLDFMTGSVHALVVFEWYSPNAIIQSFGFSLISFIFGFGVLVWQSQTTGWKALGNELQEDFKTAFTLFLGMYPSKKDKQSYPEHKGNLVSSSVPTAAAENS